MLDSGDMSTGDASGHHPVSNCWKQSDRLHRSVVWSSTVVHTILSPKHWNIHITQCLWNKNWEKEINFFLSLFQTQVEVKPYVLDDQLCDECQGARCGGKFAPFFCANVTCLQYYCEYCWAAIHSRAGREFHKPLVKEGGDRPRHISFRWN